MSLIERIDAARARWNVLEHPFYKRWSCGELSRGELAHYAGEYRHAVVALADTAAKAGNEEHAREEAAHIDLWDEFAAAFGADTTREPSPETTDLRRPPGPLRKPSRGSRRPLRDRGRAAGRLADEARRPRRALRRRDRRAGRFLLRASHRARPRARRRVAARAHRRSGRRPPRRGCRGRSAG